MVAMRARPLLVSENMYHALIHGMIHTSMIQSTKGKLADNAVKGNFGNGFPSVLVRRTRPMLTALDAATQVKDS